MSLFSKAGTIRLLRAQAGLQHFSWCMEIAELAAFVVRAKTVSEGGAGRIQREGKGMGNVPPHSHACQDRAWSEPQDKD